MHRFRAALILVAVLTLGAATVAFAGPGRGDRDRDHDRGDRGDRHHDRGKGHRHIATASLRDASGDRVGRVWFEQHGRDGAVTVFARVHDLPPGFHGFHIHTTGVCEPPDFTSAGGHFNPTDASHGDHAGDLPTLLVNEDGSGLLAAATDRFTLRDLRDDDGSAVMVHELADNYANIPDRYTSSAGGTGPDEETLSTGDAGSRLACGELR
jgi:Cu-Zn family superoxide dismutase